jgi:hypothetical protein
LYCGRVLLMDQHLITEATSSKRKRGPKPFGVEAMTPAERKRRSRQKMKDQGDNAEFMITLSRGMLAFIDQLAVSGSLTRSATIALLLETTISNMAVAVAEAKQAFDSGASDQAVEVGLKARLGGTVPTAIISEYKEILSIK